MLEADLQHLFIDLLIFPGRLIRHLVLRLLVLLPVLLDGREGDVVGAGAARGGGGGGRGAGLVRGQRQCRVPVAEPNAAQSNQ